MTDTDTNDALDALTDDGDTYTDTDGRTYRLRIVTDESHSLNDDGDWYGSIEYADAGPTNNYGWRTRPDNFDGNAEKLGIGRSYDRYWWQPPADIPRTDEHFTALRQSVIDALEYGYVGITVELLDGKDAYGRPIVRAAESLWGIEAMVDANYRRDIIGQLIEQLDDTDGRTNQ